MANAHRLSPVILAAGASTRFGSQKLLTQIPDHSASTMPLLAKTIATYQGVFETVNVVVNPDDHDVTDLVLACDAVAIKCPLANAGMSQSLIAGVRATNPELGWLIGLGDMPFLLSSTLQSIADVLTVDNIAVPHSHNERGNPVAFGVKFEQDLLELNGDRGARSVVSAHENKIAHVSVTDPGIFYDIDTPEDVSRWPQNRQGLDL